MDTFFGILWCLALFFAISCILYEKGMLDNLLDSIIDAYEKRKDNRNGL